MVDIVVGVEVLVLAVAVLASGDGVMVGLPGVGPTLATGL